MQEEKTQKKRCRINIRQLKQQFTVEELYAKSLNAIKKLQENFEFKQAKTIMIYYSLPDEVNTHGLIHEMLGYKRIILPIVMGIKAFPVELLSENQLAEGPFHIMEPQNSCVFTEKIDLIVVPGVAFNRQGHRLGRGKGYYDGLLAHYPDVQKIGLCFDFQIVETIPTEQHDIIMDKIITD